MSYRPFTFGYKWCSDDEVRRDWSDADVQYLQQVQVRLDPFQTGGPVFKHAAVDEDTLATVKKYVGRRKRSHARYGDVPRNLQDWDALYADLRDCRKSSASIWNFIIGMKDRINGEVSFDI